VENRKAWRGTVVMIGQPAEEGLGGARAMIADGLFTRFPKPDYALALHDSSGIPAGTVSVPQLRALSISTSMDMVVKGVGGHGAYPASTKDPVALALMRSIKQALDPAGLMNPGRVIQTG
jgi:hippurate hydrolase